LRAVLSYDTHDVFLSFVSPPSLAPFAASAGAGGFGRVLDTASPSATGDLANVIVQLAALSGDAQRTALRQAGAVDMSFTPRTLIPTQFEFTQTIRHVFEERERVRAASADAAPGAGGLAGLATATLASGMVAPPRPAVQPEDDRWGAWGQAFGAHGSASGSTSFSDEGAAFGVDRQLSDALTLGLSVASFHTGADASAGLTHTGIDDLTLALYANRETEAGYVFGIAAHGDDDYATARLIPIGAALRVAGGTHSGDTYAGYLEAGLKRRCGRIELRPLAGLQYTDIHQGGFAEAGAGALNLAFSSSRTDSLQGSLGFRAIWQPPDNPREGNVAPELRARWVHEIERGDGAVLASLPSAGGGAFTIAGPTPSRDAALVGTGVRVLRKHGDYLFFDYDALIQSGQTVHSADGGYQLRF